MAATSTKSVRDDNLRLLLSQQEADYIQGRLLEAGTGIRINAAASAGALFYLLCFAGGVFSRFWQDIPGFIQGLANLGAFIAAVTAIYGLICLAGAWLSLLRYKSYQQDHEKFLKQYRRHVR